MTECQQFFGLFSKCFHKIPHNSQKSTTVFAVFDTCCILPDAFFLLYVTMYKGECLSINVYINEKFRQTEIYVVRQEIAKMKRIALCDSSKEVLVELQTLLSHQYKKSVQISTYPSVKELLRAWQRDERKKADIILMDVRTEEENGIAAARQLQELFGDIKIIFTASTMEYVEDIFEVNPVFLLIKPIRQEKLYEAVDRAMNQIDTKEAQTVTLISKSFIARVRAEDIAYVESERRVLTVHSLEEDIRVNMKLSDLEEHLPEYFVRVHQSYLVNMYQIKLFSAKGVELLDGRSVPVSRPRYAKAKECFLQFLGEHEE